MMTGLWRNPEVRMEGCVSLVFTVAVTAAAMMWSPSFGLYVAGVCLGGGAISLCFTRRRYKRLAQLSTELDGILYGDDSMDFIPDEEGELAVLGSKLYKMTVRLREQAEELKKEKTYLQESLADISHQVKTPLTSIHMLLMRLSEETDDTERARISCSINSLLTRTEWLIAALLKMARLESGTISFKREPVRALDVVRKAAEPLEVPMELKEQRLLLEGREDVLYQGDSLWSAEALGNILKNCMEHTPQKGTVAVRVEENPIYTQIRIEDSGSGLSEADRSHIFERFYRGKGSAGDSVGIGLALSAMIIRRQNGTIRADHGELGGAVFCIRFYKGAV